MNIGNFLENVSDSKNEKPATVVGEAEKVNYKTTQTNQVTIGSLIDPAYNSEKIAPSGIFGSNNLSIGSVILRIIVTIFILKIILSFFIIFSGYFFRKSQIKSNQSVRVPQQSSPVRPPVVEPMQEGNKNIPPNSISETATSS